MRCSHVAYALLLATAGCEKTDPLFCDKNPGANGCTEMRDSGNDDAPFDVDPTIDARLCYGAGAYAFCLDEPAIDPVIYTGSATLDTSATNAACKSVTWSVAGQPDACVIAGSLVQIPTLTVTGNRPLVLISTSTLEITGTLDVAGHRLGLGNKFGPGANTSPCVAGTPGVGSVDGGSGGAGGSFMSIGGDGGDGIANNNGVASDAEQTTPTRLRAGCHGTPGGFGHGTAGAGPAGFGGGGVYIYAATQITLAEGAIINASGGAGGEPTREGGGGGGGSGGMIVLAAPTIVGQGAGAFIIANGGGGGGGADDTGGGTGVGGDEPDPTMPTVAAAGGSSTGGNGGDGATGALSAQPGQNGGTNVGGGGGGGGRGYIQSNVMPTSVSFSPAVTVVP